MAFVPATPSPHESSSQFQSTPYVHKQTAQQFTDHAAENVNDIYRKICEESKRYYHVGVDPEEFLTKFLPWNAKTPQNYRKKEPGEDRTRALLSVPPSKGQVENSMYSPFVSALDQWVSKDELNRFSKSRIAQSLRFLHSSIPDKSCGNLNVDVATYWQDELLQDERQGQEEDEEGVKYCASFARLQTHEEFKPSVLYDAFQHSSDEKLRKRNRNKKRRARKHANTSGGEHNRTNEEAEEQKVSDEEEEDNVDEEGETIDGGGDNFDEVEARAVDERVGEAHGASFECTEENKQDDGEEIVDKAGRFLANTEHGIHTRGQITAYAGATLSMNFRKHFFSMLIIGRYARFIRWDRRGAVVTYRFDYTKRPKLVFDFYRRYGQLDPIQRDFDPSATQCDLPENVVQTFARYCDKYGGADFFSKASASKDTTQRCRGFRVEVYEDGKETETVYVPSPMYTRTCLMPFHRGTKRSLACLTGKKDANLQVFFMKDSWQEVSSRAVREAEIYRKLEKAKVQHVASMRLGGDVPNMETESQKWLEGKFGKMVCHRIVLETVARSLSTFTWCKVLLSCIADAIEGALQAYKAGILHRDLSAGNIMIVRDAKTGEWRGILIDWDMCLLWTDCKGQTRSGRTGTWAFMSIRVQMSEGPYVHTLGDDLESAFWVLIYHLLLYTQHDLVPVNLSKRFKLLFGSELGSGEQRKDKLASLHLGDTSTIAVFKRDGLSDLLHELGTAFYERYRNNIKKPTIDLDDPENNWLATVLRETALKMEPVSVTPKALESLTKDSKPPDDPKMWKRADLKSHDLVFMRQLPNPYASTKTQGNQSKRIITSTTVNYLDGLSVGSKHSLNPNEGTQEEPAPKKPRQDSPSPSRRPNRKSKR